MILNKYLCGSKYDGILQMSGDSLPNLEKMIPHLSVRKWLKKVFDL